MPKSFQQKLKILYLMRVFAEKTDEAHPMSRRFLSNLTSRCIFICIFVCSRKKSRLFHLSFELGVPFPYPCQCGMGGNTIIGNQCVTNISNLNFSHF